MPTLSALQRRPCVPQVALAVGSLRFVIYEGTLGVVCVVGPYRNILGLSVWLGAAPIPQVCKNL
jgi:hypothetical protein